MMAIENTGRHDWYEPLRDGCAPKPRQLQSNGNTHMQNLAGRTAFVTGAASASD